jgi:hypothetical protein
MSDFLLFIGGILAITIAVIVFSIVFGSIQYIMGKYGFQIIFGAFITFVLWIGYGAIKRK